MPSPCCKYLKEHDLDSHYLLEAYLEEDAENADRNQPSLSPCIRPPNTPADECIVSSSDGTFGDCIISPGRQFVLFIAISLSPFHPLIQTKAEMNRVLLMLMT